MEDVTTKANLFVVGAAKAGTSTIYTCLDRHPEICMSVIKEPNYFSNKEVKNLGMNLGCTFVTTDSESDYQSLFKKIDSKYKGEASVSYLSTPAVAEKIYNYNSHSRILIALRDPIKRAVSHHAMDFRLGICKVSLEEIIANRNEHRSLFDQYVTVGKYSKQIQEYFEAFDSTKIHFVDFDDLHDNLDSTINEVFSFLNVAPISSIHIKKNEGVTARNPIIRALYRQQKYRELAKNIFPSPLLDLTKKVFFKKNTYNKTTSEKLNRMLFELFVDDTYEVERILEKSLDKWRITYE